MLKFTTDEMGTVLVIAFEVADAAQEEPASTLREGLYRTIKSHPGPRFALDLGAVSYMASSDIGFLLTLKRRINDRDGTVVLFDVNPFIVDVLDKMKLLAGFEIAESQADALVRLAAAPR